MAETSSHPKHVSDWDQEKQSRLRRQQNDEIFKQKGGTYSLQIKADNKQNQPAEKLFYGAIGDQGCIPQMSETVLLG